MTDKIAVAVIGMGGYGIHYVRAAVEKAEEYGIHCVGMVDIRPENCPLYEQVVAQGIPVYGSVEELFEEAAPQLTFIATPIQFHCRQACCAMEHGSHVLCEKPAAPTMEQVRQMEETSMRTGKFLAIGFQRCFAEATLKAKRDVLSGKYGKAIQFKAGIIMRRGLIYYQRGWAGRWHINGEMIYDSVANNSAAHYLQNMLFMAGPGLSASAEIKDIWAEMYRVNDIENYDTISARMTAQNGAELFFVATHAADGDFGFEGCCEFEKGKVFFDPNENVWGELNDGTRIDYGNAKDDYFAKIRQSLDCVRGKASLTCDIRTATPHTAFIEYVQTTFPITDLQHLAQLRDNALPGNAPSMQKYIPGMTEAVKASYENCEMLSKTLFGESEYEG